ncbi:TPA: hypothetical protein ACOBT2_002377, partial [Enterococcus faecium]
FSVCFLENIISYFHLLYWEQEECLGGPTFCFFLPFFLIKRKNSYFFQSDTFTMELEINIDPSLNGE